MSPDGNKLTLPLEVRQVHEFKYLGSFISASMTTVPTNAAAQIGSA